ncbi:MAG: hypothetical protein IKO42_06335 [Opitutales bacterium]|nr:hypothetical protein [Opitutales bacterium]
MLERITGIVLDKALRGESGVLFAVFSAELGLCRLYKRVSQKKTVQLPDFFDAISAEAEKSKTGGMYFLRDFENIASHPRIAEDYGAFSDASEIAKCALKNAAYLERFAEMHALLQAAFAAINSGANSACVRVKFMYVFARGEGYPIKEDFAASLNAQEFSLLKKILNTPAAELGAEVEGARELLEKMMSWIAANTDIAG